ncbi:uncharacterized protein CTRU02_214950 [Colletotrichum truncatum]|uniref:Uncharacterized protein n=1 Tax=Colletotrichum truncatum TaxID=5467 RepID=A0ACC3YE98_COLTU|nr:uncharacterized protein CTRU02_08297 [Colletotrichum truncatum]KAF6790168.1 hypothetical protein CTRU02_08297 [Colletotrichum truncatum]
MKFLAILAAVSAVSALASDASERIDSNPGAIELHPTAQELQRSSSGFTKVVRSDVEGLPLGKRLNGIPIPYNVEHPERVILGGVVITFTMVGKWIRQGTGSAYVYVCKSMTLTNTTEQKKAISVIGNGISYFVNKIFTGHRIDSIRAPEGGFPAQVDIVVGNA